MFSDLRKRTLLMVLKQVIGRFVNIHKEHIVNTALTYSGLKFETDEMQLNEQAINSQLLQETPLRLVKGHISKLNGEISLDLSASRALEVEGLDLTFDVMGTEARFFARPETGASPCSPGLGSRGSHAPVASGDHMNSSMLAGNISQDMLSGETLQDGELADQTIDTSVDAISSALKTLICSINGSVGWIIVRFRIPPRGREIVPGTPPPPGTVVAIVHLEEGFHIKDESDPKALGNSFSKRIQFGGIVVQLLAVEEDSEKLKHSNTIFSGQKDRVENELTISYSDVQSVRKGDNLWKVSLGFQHMHLLLTPMQLSRLVHVSGVLLSAPDGGEYTSGSDNVPAPLTSVASAPIHFTATIAHLSSTLLEHESKEISTCWKQFYNGTIPDPQKGLTGSHFGLRLKQLRLRILMPPPEEAAAEDPLGAVLAQFGGVHIQIGLHDIEVTEKVASDPGEGPHPASTVLRLRKLQRQKGTLIGGSIRTTCPLPPPLAKKSGISVAHVVNGEVESKHVVRQEISIFAFAAIEIAVDVETLKRIVRFKHVMYSTIFPETFLPRPESFFDDDDLDDLHSFTETETSPSRQCQRHVKSHVDPTASPAAAVAPVSINEQHITVRDISVVAEVINVEFRFLRKRKPSPDFYGPLLQQLFEDLDKRPSSDVHLFPHSLHLRLSGVNVVFPRGDSADIVANLGVAQCMIMDRSSKEETEILSVKFSASPLDVARGSPSAALKNPCLRLRRDDCRTIATRPEACYFNAEDSEAVITEKENIMARRCMVNLGMRIHSVTAAIHQDSLLLLLFMADQIVDCTLSALNDAARYLSTTMEMGQLPTRATAGLFYSADSQGASACASRVKSAVVGADSSTVVQLQVGYAFAELYAIRLAASGKPVGDPLWLTRSKAERERLRPDLMFHRYVLELAGTDIFIMSLGVDSVSTMYTNVRVSVVDFHERLPNVETLGHAFTPPLHGGYTPPWGGLAPLLRSYSQLYHRSHSTKADPNDRAVKLTLIKHTDMGQLTQNTNVDASLNRVSVQHAPAHDGDHWLFVLMSFFADTPNMSIDDACSSSGDSSGDSRCVESTSRVVAPLATTTRVKITAADTMIQYRPISRELLTVILCPVLAFDTGTIYSDDPRVTMSISFDSLIVMLHEHFMSDLLEYDAAEGTSSVFGHTRRNVASDLELIGFATLLSCGAATPKRPVVSLRIQDIDEKPLFVEVTNLKGEITAANDSFYLFQLVISHFLGGVDQFHIPAPHVLIGGNGEEHVRVKPLVKQTVGPRVCHLVDNALERIASLRRQKLRDVCSYPLRSGCKGEEVPSRQSRRDSLRKEANGPLPKEASELAQPETIECDFSPPPSLLGHSALNVSSTGNLPGRFNVPEEDECLDGFDTMHDFAFADSALRHSASTGGPAPPVWQLGDAQRGVSAEGSVSSFDLARCFVNSRHFTPSASSGTFVRSSVERKVVRLRSCPSIAVEIVVHECDFVVKLFGGVDLTSTAVVLSPEAAAFEGTATASFFDAFQEQLTIDGFKSFRRARNSSELIIARLHDIFVQVDSFEPGHNKAMHLIVKVRDAEIEDRIEGSPVKRVLMCSVPPENRDNDGHVFEMRWVTVMPASPGGVRRAQEEVAIRLQPIAVALHRRTVDLLMKFFLAPDVETEPSTTFYSKFYVHPLTLTLYVFPEVHDAGAAVSGDVYELVNFLPSSIEGSRIATRPITIVDASAEELGSRLTTILLSQYGKLDLLLLLCRVEVVRSVMEGGQAVADLVMTPMDYYRRSKGLHDGIARGIANFSSRITAEAFRAAATATRSASSGIHGVAGLLRAQEVVGHPMPRGGQARSASEGVMRGMGEVAASISTASTVVRMCFRADGSVTHLPVAALLPLNGLLRGMTHALLGVRNSIKPEHGVLEKELFK